MLPMKAGLPARALRIVPYLTPEEIQQLCAGCQGRQRDRDALLILVLFQGDEGFWGRIGLARLGHHKSPRQKEYGIMRQKLQMVEFGVAALEEVRTLVRRWKKVLAGLAREDEGPLVSGHAIGDH